MKGTQEVRYKMLILIYISVLKTLRQMKLNPSKYFQIPREMPEVAWFLKPAMLQTTRQVMFDVLGIMLHVRYIIRVVNASDAHCLVETRVRWRKPVRWRVSYIQNWTNWSNKQTNKQTEHTLYLWQNTRLPCSDEPHVEYTKYKLCGAGDGWNFGEAWFGQIGGDML